MDAPDRRPGPFEAESRAGTERPASPRQGLRASRRRGRRSSPAVAARTASASAAEISVPRWPSAARFSPAPPVARSDNAFCGFWRVTSASGGSARRTSGGIAALSAAAKRFVSSAPSTAAPSVLPIERKKRSPAEIWPSSRSGKAFCATTVSTLKSPPMPSPITAMLRTASSSVVAASMRASSSAPPMAMANRPTTSAL